MNGVHPRSERRSSVEYDRLDSREELDARLELLRQAHTEGEALEAKLEGWPAEVKAIVKGPDREEFLDGERETWERRDRLVWHLRAAEVRMLEGYREQLELLRDHLGAWRPEPISVLEFDEGFPETAFVQAQHRVEVANEERRRLVVAIDLAR